MRASATRPDHLTNVNGTLFFEVNGGPSGRGLWKSDGTAAGTVLVKSDLGGVGELTNVKGTLFFSAYDSHGVELWKSDGTSTGTQIVKDINSGTYKFVGVDSRNHPHTFSAPNSSKPAGLVNVSGIVFFSAEDATNGRELWRSDGTSKGTFLVKDINPGAASGAGDLVKVNSSVYLWGNDGTNGWELWKSAGTAASTFLVKDINPVPRCQKLA
jgi:trimeric autotransporter adhesin